MKTLVVAGIGTGVGKTVISAILVEALGADYWKPVQAGDLQNSDTITVQNLVSSKTAVFHPEKFRLTQPMSPHAAAAIDGVTIRPDELDLPQTSNTLVVELAGGLMVPVNETEVNLDLLKKWNAPVVLVSKNYLGSINHTLLSLELLKIHKVPVLGILFNGMENKASESFILNYTKVKYLGHVQEFEEMSKQELTKQALALKNKLDEAINAFPF